MTKVYLDLVNNIFKFGNIADGCLDRLENTLIGNGTLRADYVGEINQPRQIPITVPVLYKPSNNYRIVIVGAGGTGGYVIRDLVRFIYALKAKGDTRQFHIQIYDDDTVEQKNILRQNFLPRDLGQNKAEVNAKRYSNAYGLEIEAIPEKISESFTDTLNYNEVCVMVGCVDNNAGRRTMESIARHKGVHWIDSGNESKSGQVVFGSTIYTHSITNSVFTLPLVTEYHPEIMDVSQDEKEEDHVSCAERTTVDTQNIFVNMSAAMYALNYIRAIILSEKITISKIAFNIRGVTEPTYITKDFIAQYEGAF